MAGIYFDDKVYHRYARTKQPRNSLNRNTQTKSSSDLFERSNENNSRISTQRQTLLSSLSESKIESRDKVAKATRVSITGDVIDNSKQAPPSRRSARFSLSNNHLASPRRPITPRGALYGGSNFAKSLPPKSIELGPSPERHLSNRYGQRPKTSSYSSRISVENQDRAQSRRPHTSSTPRAASTLQRNIALYSRAGSARESRSGGKSNALATGELEIKLQVEDIDVNPDTGQDLVSTLTNKVLAIYDTIIGNESKLLIRLNQTFARYGFEFLRIKIGSVILIVRCDSLEGLSSLEKLYESETLCNVLNDIFVTSALLNELDVAALRFRTRISAHQIASCRGLLLASDMGGKKQKSPPDDELYTSRVDCVNKLTHVRNDLSRHLAAIHAQHNYFLSYISDFFMVLKLCKPVQLKSFDCIDDVISCYQYLRNSQSIGNSVRTDLVQDFLDIVQTLRTAAECAYKEVHDLEKYLFRYVTEGDLDGFKKRVQKVNILLSPKTRFDELPQYGGMKVNILDKQLFGSLLRYIPALLCENENLNEELGSFIQVLNHGKSESREDIRLDKQVHEDFQSQDTIDTLVNTVMHKVEHQVRSEIDGHVSESQPKSIHPKNLPGHSLSHSAKFQQQKPNKRHLETLSHDNEPANLHNPSNSHIKIENAGLHPVHINQLPESAQEERERNRQYQNPGYQNSSARSQYVGMISQLCNKEPHTHSSAPPTARSSNGGKRTSSVSPLMQVNLAEQSQEFETPRSDGELAISKDNLNQSSAKSTIESNVLQPVPTKSTEKRSIVGNQGHLNTPADGLENLNLIPTNKIGHKLSEDQCNNQKDNENIANVSGTPYSVSPQQIALEDLKQSDKCKDSGYSSQSSNSKVAYSPKHSIHRDSPDSTPGESLKPIIIDPHLKHLPDQDTSSVVSTEEMSVESQICSVYDLSEEIKQAHSKEAVTHKTKSSDSDNMTIKTQRASLGFVSDRTPCIYESNSSLPLRSVASDTCSISSGQSASSVCYKTTPTQLPRLPSITRGIHGDSSPSAEQRSNTSTPDSPLISPRSEYSVTSESCPKGPLPGDKPQKPKSQSMVSQQDENDTVLYESLEVIDHLSPKSKKSKQNLSNNFKLSGVRKELTVSLSKMQAQQRNSARVNNAYIKQQIAARRSSVFSLDGYGISAPQNTPTTSMLFNEVPLTPIQTGPTPSTKEQTQSETRQRIVHLASSMSSRSNPPIPPQDRIMRNKALQPRTAEKLRDKNFNDVLHPNRGLSRFMGQRFVSKSMDAVRPHTSVNRTMRHYPSKKNESNDIRIQSAMMTLPKSITEHRSSLALKLHGSRAPRNDLDPISAVLSNNRPQTSSRSFSLGNATPLNQSGRSMSARPLVSNSRSSILSEEEGPPKFKVIIRSTSKHLQNNAASKARSNYEYNAFSSLTKAVSKK